MEDAKNNNEVLDEVSTETEEVTKTTLYGSKKDGRVKSYKKRQKKSNNLIYKARKAAKRLDKEKFKKVIHTFRTTTGDAQIAAAKMIIRSDSKQAA